MEYVYFGIYFLIINIIGFVMMYSDKQKAKKDQYRTREKSFFVVSLLLGAIGTYIGMYKFRHKTKILRFTIGFPTILISEICLIVYLIVTDRKNYKRVVWNVMYKI